MNTNMGKWAKGFGFWLKGAKEAFLKPTLWKYFLIPVLVNISILFVLFFFGWRLLEHHLPEKVMVYPETANWFLEQWYTIKLIFWTVVNWLLRLFFLAVFLVSYVILFVFSSTLIGSPFYDLLSLKLERIHRSKVEDPPFSFKNSIVFPLKSGMKMAFFELLIALFLFPLNWIPLAGSVLYFCVMCYVLSVALIAYCTDRRFWGLRRSIAFVWKWRWEWIGFGMASFVSMMPFGLSVITFPLSICGATLLFLEECIESESCVRSLGENA